MTAKRKIRRWLVDSRRNSITDYPLSHLDWGNWWVDRSCGLLYLHVRSRDGETWHRVMCRHADRPGIEMRCGLLYWMVP